MRKGRSNLCIGCIVLILTIFSFSNANADTNLLTNLGFESGSTIGWAAEVLALSRQLPPKNTAAPNASGHILPIIPILNSMKSLYKGRWND